MKSNKIISNTMFRMTSLLKDFHILKVIWSFIFAFALTILILRHLKRRSSKINKPVDNLANESLSLIKTPVDSCINLNNCFKWLYFSSETTRKINDLLVNSLNAHSVRNISWVQSRRITVYLPLSWPIPFSFVCFCHNCFFPRFKYNSNETVFEDEIIFTNVESLPPIVKSIQGDVDNPEDNLVVHNLKAK